MKKLILLIFSFILFNSCSSNDSLFDPTYLGEGFKGITFTFDDPTPYKIDPSDWCYIQRFGKDKGIELVDVEDPIVPTQYSVFPAYPNPSTLGGTVTLRFNLPEVANVFISVINKDYQVLTVLLNETLNAGVYFVELNTNIIGSGVYRIVFETVKMECTGDIWIKNKN